MQEWKWVAATVTCWRTDASDRNSRRMTLSVAFPTRRDATSRDVPWRYHQPRSQRGSPQAGRLLWCSFRRGLEGLRGKACQGMHGSAVLRTGRSSKPRQAKPILSSISLHFIIIHSFANRDSALFLNSSLSLTYTHTHTYCCYTIDNCSRGPKVCIALPFLKHSLSPLAIWEVESKISGVLGPLLPIHPLLAFSREIEDWRVFSFFSVWVDMFWWTLKSCLK